MPAVVLSTLLLLTEHSRDCLQDRSCRRDMATLFLPTDMLLLKTVLLLTTKYHRNCHGDRSVDKLVTELMQEKARRIVGTSTEKKRRAPPTPVIVVVGVGGGGCRCCGCGCGRSMMRPIPMTRIRDISFAISMIPMYDIMMITGMRCESYRCR